MPNPVDYIEKYPERTIRIFTRVLGSQKITRDTLLASASVYFLLAIVWAMLFQLIELLQPRLQQELRRSERRALYAVLSSKNLAARKQAKFIRRS